jgi:glycosyltransferase involved in cell wall biosynthesis
VFSFDKCPDQPGISAVLAGHLDEGQLYGTVLDVAAVLDALIDDNFEVILVVDGSADRPIQVLDELRVRCPGLRVRCATDVAAGFDAAAYDLILLAAADGQFDMRELNHFLEAIERGADLAIGYRTSHSAGLGWRLRRWAWYASVRLLFGATARDADCSFKLFRRAVWERVAMQPTSTTLNTELLVRARRLGFRVDELPVTCLARRRDAECPAGWPALRQMLGELWALRRGLEQTRLKDEDKAETPPSPAKRVA